MGKKPERKKAEAAQIAKAYRSSELDMILHSPVYSKIAIIKRKK